MTISTVKLLNQLNQDFYDQIGPSFSASRDYFWPGWTDQLSEVLPQRFSDQKHLSVLDLGCGNGRFGEFLRKLFPQEISISYLGIDQNQRLLQDAHQKLGNLANLDTNFIQQDLIELLLNNQDLVTEKNQRFDIIAILGVMHHLPSFDLKQQLLTKLAGFLKPNGIMILTFWQFMNDPKLAERAQTAHQFLKDIPAGELDENDYILDWKRGDTAYRYCHLIDQVEQKKLLSMIPISLTHSFRNDGYQSDMNQYWLLSPKSVE